MCNYFLNINIPEARSLTQNSGYIVVLEIHFHIVLSLCYTTCRHRNYIKYSFYVNRTHVFIIVPQNTMWVENLDAFTYFCYKKWCAYFIFLKNGIYLPRIWAIFSFCLSRFEESYCYQVAPSISVLDSSQSCYLTLYWLFSPEVNSSLVLVLAVLKVTSFVKFFTSLKVAYQWFFC